MRTYTPANRAACAKYWEPIRQRLLAYFQAAHGNKRRMAKATGIADSQLHTYTCPICEHNTEPSYSIAMVCLAYIEEQEAAATEKKETTYRSLNCLGLLQVVRAGFRPAFHVSPNRAGLRPYSIY